MAERALPDLVSRLLIDTSPLNVAAAAAASALGGLVSKAKDAGGEVEKHFNSTSQQLNLFGDNAEKNGKKATDSLRGVGVGLLGVGSVITATAVAVGVESLKMASEFDNATRQLAGSAQIPVQAAQAIGQSFLTSGEKTTFSAQQMVSALAPVSGQLELLSGHALTTAESHQVMSAAADLAEASHTDLGSATKTLSAVMVAYKIPLAEADDATNSLFNTSRAVNVPLDELQSALAKIHARLGDVSPGLNDTNTLMVDLAINGITGSRAVTAASSAFLTLLGGTKPVTDELGKLNVHLYDAKGQFVGMDSVIGQLQKAEAGMTTQQKDQTNSILFGSKASQELNAVISGGTATWERAAKTVDTAGAAHKAAGDAMSGVEGQQKLLAAQMSNLGVVIGTALLPALNSVLGAITPIISAMASWAAANPKLATGILIGAAALGVLLVVVGGFLVVLPGLIALSTALDIALLPLIGIPLLIAAGIIALIAVTILIITHWNQITAFITRTMVPALLGVWHWIQQLYFSHQQLATIILLLVSPLIVVAIHWREIWAIMQALAGWIVGFFIGMWSGLVGAVTGAWSAIYGAIAGFIGAIIGILGAIYGAFASTFGAIYGAVAGAIGAVVGFITAALSAVWLFLSTWGAVILVLILSPFILGAAAIAAVMVQVYNTVAGWLSALAGFVGGILGGIYNFFYGTFLGIWNFAAGVFAGLYNTIAAALSAIWGFIVGWGTTVFNFYFTIFTGIWNFLAAVFTGIFNTVWTWLTAIWTGVILPILTGIWNFFVSIWTTIWNFLVGIWTGIWNTISFWATTIWNTIVQIFTNVWNFIVSIWTTVWNWLVATWTGIWNSVGQFFGNIYNTISDWTTRTWQRLSEGWNYIKDGLGSLVKGIVDDIWTKFHEGLNAVIKIINDFLGAVDSVLTNSPLHITVLNGVRIPPFEGGGVVPVGSVGGALESGGLIPGFCAGGCPPGGCGHGMGGAVRGVGAGFKTTEPTFIRALTGEGRAPEYVIPTEGRYRANAAALWHQAGEELGLLAGQVPGFNIAHIRHERGGILGLAVGGSIPTSGEGGECLAFVCQTSGIGCGYPAAADAAALCNSGTIKAGDVFITTEGPFGHAGYVLDANTALDSNFHLDHQIHEHPMADIYGLGPICFIEPGVPFGGASPSGGGGIGSKVTDAIRSAVQVLFGPFEGAMGAVPGLPGVIGQGLVKSIENGVLSLIPVISPSGPQSAAANACQVVDWAKQGGFSGQAMYNAAAIALAESSGNPDPNATFTSDVNGGTYGLMQFNQAEWAQWGSRYGSIGDPVAQMRAAFDYSRGGSFFDPWCTSTAAMNASGIGGCNGAGGATAGKFLAAVEACKEMGGVLPTDAYSFDQGGRWRTGTWGYNGSGHDELVLNKEQQRGLGGGGDEVLEVLQRIEQKVMGHLEVNTYGTNLTPRDVAREIVQEVRAI